MLDFGRKLANASVSLRVSIRQAASRTKNVLLLTDAIIRKVHPVVSILLLIVSILLLRIEIEVLYRYATSFK